MQWISVEERLPENHQEVLCLAIKEKTEDDYESPSAIFEAQYVDEIIWSQHYKLFAIKIFFTNRYCIDIDSYKIFNPKNGENYCKGKITHWMPLPTPPRTNNATT